MAEITDRDKLDLNCKSTIQFAFGSICDVIQDAVIAGSLNSDIGEAMKRKVRRHGNDAARVVSNHLDFYNISRNHRKDLPNPERAARRAANEG